MSFDLSQYLHTIDKTQAVSLASGEMGDVHFWPGAAIDA